MIKVRITYPNGQSAAELAIFGAMVMFVIGLILRVSLGMSHSANMSLRAFRMALRESYITAEGTYTGAKFSGARNKASVLVLEDRLAIDPSQKQGTRDRAPYMAMGSGSMTHTMMMNINPADLDDIAVFDIFINGQRFPLTTSSYEVKNLADLRASGDIADCNADGYGHHTGVCYDSATNEYTFFRKAYNGEGGWCFESCSADWPADRRFDLNFDGVTDVSAVETFHFYDYELGATDTPFVRKHFSWQWIPVRESSIPDRRNRNNPLFFDVDGDWKDEMFVRATRSTTDSSLISIAVTDPQGGDMDGSADGGTEEWWNIWRTRQLSLGLPDPGPYRQPGIQPESTVYSFTKDGTLLQNREGQLFSHDGQFIRNETRQDHLDIIERVLYLSNDTGRFCSVGGGGTPCSSGGGACQPTVWGQSDYAKSRGLRGMINPVERCGNCFSSANHKYTCMDSATSSGPTIFVRSRIRDRRRVRWVTRTAR